MTEQSGSTLSIDPSVEPGVDRQPRPRAKRTVRSAPTMQGICARGLTRLTNVMQIDVVAPPLLDRLAADALGPVANATLGEPRHRGSSLSDDGTPFQWSVALGGGAPEVSVVVEPQAQSGSLKHNWHTGLAANERYVMTWGASLKRFDLVKDLFEPRSSSATLAMCHAVCLAPDRRPIVTLSLDPSAAGLDNASAVICEALERLGLYASWRRTEALLARVPGSRPVLFALDLSAAAGARVEVWTAHPRATAAQVDDMLRRAGGCRANEVVGLCEALTGQTESQEDPLLLSSLAFTATHDGAPAQATVHVPVRSCVRSDAVATGRLARYLGTDLGHVARRAVKAIARRPLGAGRGLIASVSMRRTPRGRRVCIALSAEAYAVTPPGLDE